MELSTFELLVKRIAPLPMMANPGLMAVARRVIQGYFLTMSNLESTDLTFQLEFFISRPSPVDPEHTLDGRADMRYDIAGANAELFLYGDSNTTRFSTSFTLPARQTASVELLPKPLLFTEPEPTFEVRGFAVLTLPALFDLPSFSFRAQNNTPVRVMLNPEIRGTFLPNDFPMGLTGDFDQISYPLTVGSGKSANAIEPEQTFFLPLGSLNPTVRENLRQQLNAKLATASNESARRQALVEFTHLAKTNVITSAQAFIDVVNSLKVP
jgi:hypothetical protein